MSYRLNSAARNILKYVNEMLLDIINILHHLINDAVL